MPQRKSATRLETLCLETLFQNLNTLQYEARYIPRVVIKDLYDTWYKHYMNRIRVMNSCNSYKRRVGLPCLPPPFPTDLFFRSKTNIIHDSLDYFDQPADEVVAKINQFCKNLQKVNLKNIDFINAITINNPHILMMTLDHSECTDQHLSIIGKHCPQLQYLSLCSCKHITDDGINFLPEKLIHLAVTSPSQILTFKAQLIALERLSHLKVLCYFNDWHNVLEIYAASFTNGVDNRTYCIELLLIDLNQPSIYDIPHTVRTLFPKLQSLHFWSNGDYIVGSRVGSFLEAINHDVLTTLTVYVSVDFIHIAGHLCPMLKVLDISIGLERQKIEDRYLTKPQHIPFKFLSELGVSDKNAKLSTDDWKSLLANCRRLEKLHFSCFNWLTDQVIYDILAINPLNYVKNIEIFKCGPFSVKALGTLLKSAHSLISVKLKNYGRYPVEYRVATYNLIREMNWDLNLEVN